MPRIGSVKGSLRTCNALDRPVGFLAVHTGKMAKGVKERTTGNPDNLLQLPKRYFTLPINSKVKGNLIKTSHEGDHT